MYKNSIILSLFIVVLVSCQTKNEDSKPEYEWHTSTPQEQGLNSLKLDSLLQMMHDKETFPDVNSLLILRNGYKVVEEYFNGYQKGTLVTVQSVSKSFMSALIGIAIEQGIIESVDQKVISFFPNKKNIENLDDRKKAIKLEDLLTMRTGTDFHERGMDSPGIELNRLAADWDTYYLNRPMVNDPGVMFQYDSGGPVLFSSILKNLTGMHADVFADKYLFNHLNITKRFWAKNNEGHPHTGGGLHIMPEDMAKLGQLYLQNGMWEGKQIFSAKWVEESFKLHVKFELPDNHPYAGYGYYWWVLKIDPKDETKGYIYTAIGQWGQYIFVIPKYDMVVVSTTDALSNNAGHPISFLYSHILPSVQNQDK